ncbi:carboxylesterase family protein [Mycolicibacter algericus]|uniref:carboxylesterase family protein n=1 Tax=Mycolicibacter algericus TaxID=1288388 RepID=UPI0009F36B2D
MPQRHTRVTTTAGAVEGFSHRGVSQWRSIPYARPPVGSLRLRVPKAAVPWSGAAAQRGSVDSGG